MIFMKAKLVTYKKENLSNSQRSIISKTLFGYLDKSNKGKYSYKREGLLNLFKYVKVSNSTFVIEQKGWPKIKEFLEKSKVNLKTWNIELSRL